MVIDSVLNSMLTVLALSSATKEAIVAGIPTCEDLEDPIPDLAAGKKKVEAAIIIIIDTNVDVCRVMFVFDFLVMNIVDPNFAWSNFTSSVYVAEKRI
jgi:hypothetical protein